MSMLPIVVSVFLLFACANSIVPTGECTKNAIGCEGGTLCFKNSNWYSGCHKKCPNGWGCNAGSITCDKTVKDLKQEVVKVNDDERIKGFAINQLCIADKACKNKRQLDNPSWLDNILNAFVQPYILRQGEWNNKIKECHLLEDPWYNIYYQIFEPAEYRCQELMANYHIATDLQLAVNKFGCGTQHDWDLIGEYITECVKESDMHFLAEYYARWQIHMKRDAVRQLCIASRNSLGLQAEF